MQFGDGETGARLPTGIGNVVALFRSGSGARGPVKLGSSPTAPERPVGFDKVTLAGIVSGGADPEDLDKAREAAPGKVQSLGRIVSIRDHETETLAIPRRRHRERGLGPGPGRAGGLLLRPCSKPAARPSSRPCARRSRTRCAAVGRTGIR